MSDLKPAPEPTAETSLKKNQLGVLAIIFFVVAAAAPLVGMTGAVPVASVLGTGPAVPGTYILVGLALLIFSVGYVAMSSKVTNTGAFFAYVGRGLGVIPGVGSAFISMVAYLAIQLSIYGFLGAVAAFQFNDRLGIDWPWWSWTLIAWALVLALSLLRVDVGAKVLGVLLVLELGSLIITALAVLFQGGGPDGLNFWDSFSPSAVFAGGLTGSAGIALAFAFASYIGFEATAIYGEESKNPKRTVPIATYVSVLLIAVIFGLTSWAVVSGLGTSVAVDRMVEISSIDGVPLADPAAVLFAVTDEYVGSWMVDIMSWLILSSLFAGLLAFQNSSARYMFAMGRSGVLPERLDHVNGRGAPATASIVTSIITVIIILIFWWRDLDPVLNLFYWSSSVAVLAIVIVEILVSVAVIAYFRRNPVDAKAWNTLIAPIVAVIALAVGAYLLVAKFALLAGTVAEGKDPTVESFAMNGTGWFLVSLPVIAFVVGIIVGLIRRNEENADAIADLVS